MIKITLSKSLIFIDLIILIEKIFFISVLNLTMKFQDRFFILCVIFTTTCGTPTDYRWNLIPDGDGNINMIDTETHAEEIEKLFVPEDDTRFLLFTRFNPLNPQIITWTRQSIEASNFNSNHPVRFLIHGFNSGPSSGVNLAPTRTYLQSSDYNVIV